MHTYSRCIYTALICLALLGAWFAVGTVGVSAQDGEGTEAAFTQASPFDNLAVALVIDVSGSMEYTDPLRLRESSAGMFIDLLGADDYLCVVTFDHEAELIKPLEPVGSPADKAALMERLAPGLDPRGDTDFVTALELTRQQFAETDTGDRVPVIVLLTDGEPDPFPGALDDEEFMAGYMEELWEQVALLAEEEILIYNVAFSEEIDPEVIRRISDETRGLYYIMEDPGDLLVAFYGVLEALKDRRSFMEETADLGSGGSHTFSFAAEEFHRQLNLVLVGEAGAEEALQVRVNPPQGAAGDIEQLLVRGRGNYQAVILSRPQEEHFGLWEVEVTGSGQVTALGNADYYLEAVLIEPDPDAGYPLNEPLPIEVEVITRERYGDAVFSMDLQVTPPEDGQVVNVPMEREGNSFKGIFEETDLVGDYELAWQLYRDGEVFYSSSAQVAVRQLPAIRTDFFVGAEGFRLGEEMVVSASLEDYGRRLQEGPHLQIDSFNMNLEYRDGARVEMELFDDGSREHGNSRAGDGIWSNRLLFDREGPARALLTVTGQYREADFVLTRSYSFSVAEAGRIAVQLAGEDLWARAGGVLEVPLQFVSESPFSQTVRINAPGEELELLGDRAAAPAGETRTVVVEAALGEAVGPGSYYLTLEFASEDGMTVIQPEILDFQVSILTGWEAFQVQYGELGLGAALAIGAIIFLGGFVIGGGSLLNRFYLRPRLRVKGRLHFTKGGGNPGHGGAGQEVDLGRAGKREVVLSFDPDNRQADFIISNDEFRHDMVIANSWHDSLPGFVRGWKALFKPRLTVETVLECTPPGILVVDGQVLTGTELHPGDEFETGGLTFSYSTGSGTATQNRSKGVNILDDKM